MELHAVVVRERPHELVYRQAETTLVEGHEAHDVAIAWPRLRLAPQSNPLWPIGVGDRAEKTIIDERLQRLHGHIGRTPRIRLEDNSATCHGCGRRCDNGGNTCLHLLSLSLSLSCLLPLLPSSPRRSLPLFLATARGQKARVQAEKVRRVGAWLVTYL